MHKGSSNPPAPEAPDNVSMFISDIFSDPHIMQRRRFHSEVSSCLSAGKSIDDVWVDRVAGNDGNRCVKKGLHSSAVLTNSVSRHLAERELAT